MNHHQTPLYVLDAAGEYRLADAETVIAEAKRQVAMKFKRGASLTSPDAAKEAVQLQLCELDYEIFGCLFLDQKHRLIKMAELFRGSIDGTSVYPREVVRAALQSHAVAVIFFHNHPSGDVAPSEADKAVTQRLKAALGLVDIRVLDHFVVGSEGVFSFAEAGLL